MGRRGVVWLCVFAFVVMGFSGSLRAGQATSSLSSSSGDAGNAEVRGRVTDPEGHAVAGAAVRLLNVLSGAAKNVDADADGNFRVELAAGDYTLTATSAGLALEPRRIEVNAGGAIDLGLLKLPVASVREQMIVSGSRVAELQDEAPTKVLVASKEEIRNTGYERVGDVLSEIPGVVTQAQSFGTSVVGGEQIDGMDSKETLVLLDGLPFSGARGIKEGIIDLNQQDVGRLERVEVVKGAASALYGTDALGGVINLVSREPVHPFELDATTSGGSLGEIDTRLGVGGKWNNLSGYLDLEHHQRDGYTLLPDDPTTVGAYENRQDLLLKLRYAFSPRAAIGFTSTAYANHDHGLGSTFSFDPNDPANFSTAPTALRSNDSTQTYAVTGDFLLTSSTSLQTRFYDSRYGETSTSRLIESGIEGPITDPGTLNEEYRRADTTVGQQWGKYQFLQAGYEYVHDEYRGDNRIVGGNAGQVLTTNDVWIQDRIQPVRNLLLTVGGRYQDNSFFGGHIVPKAGIVYRINDHFTLRGAYGQGFRAPNLGELYYQLLHLEFGYQVIGNPTLRPETSQSYSTGGTFTAGRYQLSVNLFRNNLRNLIDNVLVCDATAGQDCSGSSLEGLLAQYGVPSTFEYDTTGAALFTFLNLNVDRAFTEGFDVDGKVALTPEPSFSGAYTYLEAVDSVNETWLPFRNRHQGHIKLEYAKPRWGFVGNIRGTFFSKYPTASADGGPAAYAYGYQIWNLYGSKSLVRGLRGFAAIDNLADSRDRKLSQDTPSFDRPDYGRTYRVGLNYTFPRE